MTLDQYLRGELSARGHEASVIDAAVLAVEQWPRFALAKNRMSYPVTNFAQRFATNMLEACVREVDSIEKEY